MTPSSVPDAETAPTSRADRQPAEKPSDDEDADPLEDQHTVTELPENASVFLSSGLSDDYQAVIVGDSVAAGWFHSLDAEGTARALPSHADAIGLHTATRSLYLAYRSASSAADGAQDATQIAQLLPRSENRRVRAFEPVELTGSSRRPNGFRIRFSGDNRDEEIFVLSTSASGDPPYVIRMPITAARRTLLKDLTGDGVREMVHLSVVFDAMGRREIIVDALQWNSAAFVHVGSVALLQEINRRLTRLEDQLQNDTDPQWIATAGRVLEPIEGSPSVASSLPAERVRVPRITELSIDLSRGEWHFSHDIAVEGNLYRLRIHLEANPLAEHPARIEGL